MNAIIDIKTPAGQFLEGFPRTVSNTEYAENYQGLIASLDDEVGYSDNMPPNPDLHKGDTITIKIV